MRSLALLLSMSALAFSGSPPPPPDDCGCKNDCEVVCTVEQDFLWPPNHFLVDVGLEATGTVQVYSDEDDVWPASAQFSPDAKQNGNLRLRSERGGPSDGRVYLIVAGDCALTVVVPHDFSAASVASVLAQAEAALEYWETNGVPPPTFFLVGDGPIIGPHQ